ncbi:MAG: phosphoglycerate dehydrogenase, partial [Verrucomicrobiota bacterium]
ELTFTHMLCGTRPIAQANAGMSAGRWDRKAYVGSELAGKTLAILGLGRIGREVARRAQVSKMRVIAYDPFITEERARALEIENVTLQEAFERADYITVHMPLTEKTKYMMDEAAFASMKDGVRVFNCARGGIIKESALIEAVKSGKVAAAGLDVYESEPLAEDSELRKLPNVVLTPHLGASTEEAQESVGIEIAEVVTDFLNQGNIQNAVNAPTIDAKTLEKLKPYLVLGQKLGSIIQQLTPDSIDVLRITYWGEIVDLDAKPLNRAIQKGYMRRIAGDAVNDINAAARIKALGIDGEITKSTSGADYNELIKIEALAGGQVVASVAGTLIGKAGNPRIVHLNGRDLEMAPQGTLLVMENRDQPGTVGKLGTLLGEDGVNIANLSLARSAKTGNALAVYELDSTPSQETLQKILDLDPVVQARLVIVD